MTFDYDEDTQEDGTRTLLLGEHLEGTLEDLASALDGVEVLEVELRVAEPDLPAVLELLGHRLVELFGQLLSSNTKQEITIR
jgi:phosphoribosylamine-glycine ligase